MAAYVASAHLNGHRPRVASQAAGEPVSPPAWSGAASEGRVLDTSPPGQQEIELRWAGVKERWSQLWFFVLDPESWR